MILYVIIGTLCALLVYFLMNCNTLAHGIYGLKSVAPYRTGLDINVNVSRKHAEEGLLQVIQGSLINTTLINELMFPTD